ncbi:hypothetical protein DSM110093_04108 (plasmid) [Sulfitobacter sp. DSM 110093]|uniref:hypothetical protein n=1 Tax=Sulfitobacter sp. DSM 110093 TaxID=2883127 RepID=UPI001FAE753E|nr:hypothetical protein [Sulfitobacter sp. DSM 110093]UOA34273.1 hypothetical protein DSM110093_04108 [Sulfitobacter sp. DSM 110093]
MASEDIDTTTLRRVVGRTPGLYMISLDWGEHSFTYCATPPRRAFWPTLSDDWKLR